MSKTKNFFSAFNSILIAFLLVLTNILILTRIDKEKALTEEAKNKVSASAFNELAEQNYLKAMEQKAEAETFRNEYYHKVFIYGYDWDNGSK